VLARRSDLFVARLPRVEDPLTQVVELL